MDSKVDSRKQLTALRQQMSEQDVFARSSQVLEQTIKAIPWESIRSLHVYVSMPLRHEVDTAELLEYAWVHYPQIMTAVPITRSRSLHLRAAKVGLDSSWHRTAQGLPEPERGELLPPGQQFDVIVVPMLGFNQDGYRIGYGGGFYDRFLAEQPRALKIGLCYQDCQIEFKPEQHDIPLDLVITETGEPRLTGGT